MLYNPLVNGFNWSVDNFGASYSDTGFAVSVGNTLTTLISGASVTEDVYGIGIIISGSSATGMAALTLYANGSFSQSLGDSLWFSNASLAAGGVHFYFPIYLSAGTSISAEVIGLSGTPTARIGVILYGKPTNPDGLIFGTRWKFLIGKEVTAGNGSKGGWTALEIPGFGIAGNQVKWIQAGVSVSDTSLTAVSYLIDIGASGTNPTSDSEVTMIIENMRYVINNTAEDTGKEAMGMKLPYCNLTAAENNIFARAACSGAPDTGVNIYVYGVY